VCSSDLVKEESDNLDYEYKFGISAQNEQNVSDTLDMTVLFKKRNICFRGEFTKFIFSGSRDTISIERKVYAFRPSARFYLYKEISIDFGFVLPVYKEDIIDSLNIFRIPSRYYSLNFSLFSIPIYKAGPKYGIGFANNWQYVFPKLPLSIEYARYDDYSSYAISGSIELPSSWIAYIHLGFYFVGWILW